MNLKNKKIYCSHNFDSYANWIIDLNGFDLCNNIDEADIVLFAGGKDIDTKFYNEPKGLYTDLKGPRDLIEYTDFQYALLKKLPIIGICRGAQLICALSGGKLIQHVTNHNNGHHKMKLKNGVTTIINSLHHQMLNPFVMKNDDYDLIGWAEKNLSTTYLNGNNKEITLPAKFVEPEIVHFKPINALAIQYHPEMMFNSYNNESVTLTQNIFLNFINKTL